jgi:uncharacterized protein involved in tolerance to divalent cations
MPLQAQVGNDTFSYPTLELPFTAKDFDFDTVKAFLPQNDKTEPKRVGEDQSEKQSIFSHDEESKSNLRFAPSHKSDHSKIQNYFDPSTMTSTLIARQKPWESHKSHSSTVQSGVIACLNQEDIDRVNHIYFTHEHMEDDVESSAIMLTGRQETEEEVSLRRITLGSNSPRNSMQRRPKNVTF